MFTQILVPFPLAPPIVKAGLVRATSCQHYLCAPESKPIADSVIAQVPGVKCVPIPSISEWITEEEDEIYPYTKTWEEAKNDPWVIFHTSGTTGIPKPIVYTQQMMTSVDIYQTLPEAGDDTQIGILAGQRSYSSIPMNHVSSR